MALCSLFAAPLWAQSESDPFADAEEFLVMSQGGRPLVFEETAIEMQVLERLDIEAQPNLSAADAVAKLPGIRTTQRIQGERAAVSIEGLPPEYTRILVNGQRYTGFVGSVADLADVPLTNLGRIEIQRGAQGLRQGPDSGGGVIDLRTLEPPVEGFRADAWGVMGSAHKRLFSTTVAAANSSRGGAAASYTHDEIGGYDPRGSQAVFVGVGGRDSVRRVDDAYLTQTFGMGREGEGAARFGWRGEEERYVSPEGVSIGGSETTRWVGTVEGNWAPADAFSTRAVLTYYQIRAENDVARRTELVDRELRGEVEASRNFVFDLFDLDVYFGVDVRQLSLSLDEAPLDFEPEEDVPALSGDRSFDKSATTGGLFVGLDARMTDWFSLTAGARLQLDTRFDPAVAPQVGLLLEPTSWLKLRAQYGRSDRYPSLNDLYAPVVAQLGGVYFLSGNPELVPEKADTWRAGFELALGDAFSLSATGFWNEIDGLIRRLPEESIQVGTELIPFGGEPLTEEEQALCTRLPTLPLCDTTPTFVESPVRADLFVQKNLERVRTRGVEGQMFWRPLDWALVRVGYTLMDTHVDSEVMPDLKRLPNEPEHTVDLELRLRGRRLSRFLGEPELSTVARFRGAALRETSGTGLAGFTSTEHTSSSWVVDVRLQLPIAEVVTLNFDVRNLTDEMTIDSYEIRGRSFFAGLRYRWPHDF